jgi:hypothetical protein
MSQLGWKHKEVTYQTTKRVLIAATCDNCGGQLEIRGAKPDDSWRQNAPLGCVVVELRACGADYPLPELEQRSAEAVICKACAEKVVAVMPVFQRTFEERRQKRLQADL